MLILSRRDVVKLLALPDCLALMGEAFRSVTAGTALMPLRSVIRLHGERRLLATMPAEIIDRVIGLKVIVAMAGNHSRGSKSHQALVLLFDPASGEPVAVIDGASITSIRTAAATAIATRELARPDASTLALLGTGELAWAHLSAMRLARRITAVRVYSPSEEHRKEFAARARAAGHAVIATDTAEEAVRSADIVCTLTSSPTPVLQHSWLKEGAHINAVGACLPTARELDTETIRHARVFVDSREAAVKESGDLLIPMGEGAIGTDHVVGEIGELLLSRSVGRTSLQDITVYKSLGMAIQDLLAAEHVRQQAVARQCGSEARMEHDHYPGDLL